MYREKTGGEINWSPGYYFSSGNGPNSPILSSHDLGRASDGNGNGMNEGQMLG